MPKQDDTVKYTGELANRIQLKPLTYRRTLLTGPSEEVANNALLKQIEAENDAVFRTIISRLPLLLKHYGIALNDDERWFRLAIKLATDHVPGFQTERRKPSGRPKTTWTAFLYLKLYMEMQQIIEKRDHEGKSKNTTMACRTLLKSAFWKERFKNDASCLNAFIKSQCSPLVTMAKAMEKKLSRSDVQEFVQIMLSLGMKI